LTVQSAPSIRLPRHWPKATTGSANWRSSSLLLSR